MFKIGYTVPLKIYGAIKFPILSQRYNILSKRLTYSKDLTENKESLIIKILQYFIERIIRIQLR